MNLQKKGGEMAQTLYAYMNKRKNISSLSIHPQWTSWERIQENNSINNSLKKQIKYRGVDLMKVVNYLYKENYKLLKKEIKDYWSWKISHAHELAEST
jgi:hypothetical protein